jgi:hypothetical protein
MIAWAKNRQYIVAVAAGLIYGVVVRLLLHWPFGVTHVPRASAWYPNDLWVMSFGFLVVAPITAGWITVSSTPSDGNYHWVDWIFRPWIAVSLSSLALLVTAIEGAICLIFATPITLVCGSIGGIAAGLAGRHRYRHGRATTFCLAVLPLALCAIEAQFDGPLSMRTVNTSVVIHAPAAVVWKNVKTVPRIDHAEIHPTWTHAIGFPLPVEATLDHDGIGGVRHATFEGGLLFVETINEWEPGQRIGFTIAADTAHIPPTTLDEHVTIGGRFFDVLDGEYRLEPLANGDILLHLQSRQRLNTDFNAYAALWTDAVMRNLQESILEVVKHRCEAEARE